MREVRLESDQVKSSHEEDHRATEPIFVPALFGFLPCSLFLCLPPRESWRACQGGGAIWRRFKILVIL